jgi:hypothetical protein
VRLAPPPYSLPVSPTYGRSPREQFGIAIDLGVDSARIDELVGRIIKEIRKLQNKRPTAREPAEVQLAKSRD